MKRRSFLTKSLLGLGAGALIYKSYDYLSASDAKGRIIIVGGGAAGITMAAYLSDMLKHPDITIIEPSKMHHYQPGYTMIAAGEFKADDIVKPNASLIPSNVKWLQDSVIELLPDANALVTAQNGKLEYDFLVMVPGGQMNFDLVEGISRETLGEGNAHCIYDFIGSQRCGDALQSMSQDGEGKMVFSNTYTKIKCGGAPKKICMIAEDLFRSNGVRDRFSFDFYSNSTNLMTPAVFGDYLAQLYEERDIETHFLHRLKKVNTSKKVATFELIPETTLAATPANANYTTIDVDFDFLHFVPPMSAPEFVKNSPLAIQEGKLRHGGWIDVDKNTMVHKRYDNIISLGDSSALPTSKTGAAIRMQAPIAAKNLVSLMEGSAPIGSYNRYTACPIVTEYGKVLMCEFKYGKELDATIPWLDPAVDRGMWWMLKRHGLKPMYYHGMLKGLL
ncbi:NAD(P)/FAD-dependent oxidoreductase [Coraliomargarita sp. W4R72]